MALQVWLPLQNEEGHGTLDNRGLSGVSFHGGPAAWPSTGKLGNCAEFSGSQLIYSDTTNDFDYRDNFTVCFWLKMKSDGYGSSKYIFTVGRADYNSFGYGAYAESATKIRIWFAGFNASADVPNMTDNWLHVAFTKSSDGIKIYTNGSLSYTYPNPTLPSNLFSESNGLGIGCFHYTGGNIYNGSFYMDDFRIYDNVLSDREIHEISKGIVLHFPLNDIYYTRSINKYSGETAAGKCSHGSFTCTKLADERGYNYSLQYTGNGNNNWYSIGFPTIKFEVGKTYDYSCKVRCNSANFGMQLRASRCCNDWSTNMVTVSNADGKWHEYHVRQTMTGTTFLRSGTTDKPNTAPELEFYTQSLATNGTVYKGSFDIKDVQVCEVSDNSSVEFTDGDLISNPINCAGYKYTAGATYGLEPIFSKDSPRYDGSYLIENLHDISIQNILGISDRDEFTIAVWVMQIEGGAYSTFLSSSNGYGGDGLWLGFNVEGCGQWAFRGGISPNYARSGDGNLSLNTWYHFVYRFNKGIVTWFLNGQKKNSTTYSGSTTMNMGPYLYLGNRTSQSQWDTTFKGKFSDFRMYATALSDKDIKELYNAPISITDKGAIMTQGEFKEV